MVDLTIAARTDRWAGSVMGPALFVLSFAAALATFWSGVAALTQAWAIPEYSHGPIIPLISTFLFLREMRTVPPSATPVIDRWPGVAVIALGLLVGVLGNLAQVTHIVTYGLIIWLAGMVLVCFGLRRGALFWPAVLHLVFMLPLPTFVYWQVSSFLQTISSEIGVAFIALVGIPVYLDGNIIDLGVYKLQVAEACSGLRYLFPMLSFSYVFAVLYNGPKWHKVTLLLAAAPITVLMNSFRIGVIGLMVDNFGIEHAEGFLHTFEGWIIFVACVVILFGLAAALQRLSRDPRPLSETLDVSFEGLGDQARRFYGVAPSAALATVLALTIVTATLTHASPEREMLRIDREPFVVFPSTLDDWRGFSNGLLDPQVERVLGADDYLSMSFRSDATRAPVDLFMAFYQNQMDGTGIHSPEVCIPAGGWEVSAWSTKTVAVPGHEPFNVNRAVIQKGESRQIVYFWFELRGKRVTGDFEAKWTNLQDSIRIGRSDGALVRLLTPMLPNEPDTAADDRLRSMIAPLLETLPRFSPS